MLVHFYTEYHNIKKIEDGIRAYVWSRCEADKTDIEITIDTNMYIIYHGKDDNYYEVQKMTWREPIQPKNVASNYY